MDGPRPASHPVGAPRPRLVRVLQLAVFALLCLPGARASAEEAGDARAAAPSGDYTAALPAFWLTGIVMAPPASVALIVVRGVDDRPVGSLLVKEGETIQGYRVVAIGEDRVSLEREGQTFSVRLGRPLPTSPSDPERVGVAPPLAGAETELAHGGVPGRREPQDADAGQTATPASRPSPGVTQDAPDEVRRWADRVIEQVLEHPGFKDALEKRRRAFQEQQQPPRVNPGN